MISFTTVILLQKLPGGGVILTEAKSGKKKRKTKKDVIKIIRNITIVLLLVIGLIKVIKKKIEKIKKKAEDAGYTKGISDGKSEGFKLGQDAGYKKGYYHGTNTGLKKGYESGYKKGLIERENGKSIGYKYGQKIGYERGYKKGWKEGHSVKTLPHLTEPQTNSDADYCAYMLDDITKYIMRIDSDITKRNGGKSVYDGNDIIKTLNNYIEILQKQNERIKGCKRRINDNYIEELDAYKEVFEIAKTAKIVSGKMIILGKSIDVPIPDELKKKIDEI